MESYTVEDSKDKKIGKIRVYRWPDTKKSQQLVAISSKLSELAKYQDSQGLPVTFLRHRSLRDPENQTIVSMVEHVDFYLKDCLAQVQSLNPFFLLSMVFLTCHGLQLAQKKLGFKHSRLTPAMIGLKQTGPFNIIHFFKYKGKVFRVPTFGYVPKIIPSQNSTLKPSGQANADVFTLATGIIQLLNDRHPHGKWAEMPKKCLGLLTEGRDFHLPSPIEALSAMPCFEIPSARAKELRKKKIIIHELL